MTPLLQSSGKAALREQRRSPRCAIQLRMNVWSELRIGSQTSASDARLHEAMVENVSLSGLFFRCGQSYEMGMAVWMRTRLGRQTHYVKGIVRRSRVQAMAGPQRYEYGVEIVRCPQSARFLAAIAPLLEQAATLALPPGQE